MKGKKLGVSWSPILPEIWEEIKEVVDSVEFANLSDLGKIPVLNWTFHYRRLDSYDMKSESLNLLNPEKIRNSFENIEAFVLKKKPRIISVHLGFPCEKVGKMPPDDHNYALSEILPREEVKERILDSLDYLTANLEIPLAIENLDYHPGGAYEYVCEPDFIREILEKNPRVFLLLDIAHVEISAIELSKEKPENRSAVTREYLKDLPLERVIELHLNAPTWENNVGLDMHLPLTRVEETLLKELLNLPNLEVVNLECGEKIEEQVRRLGNLLKEGER